ncbi:hypothetical protein SCHPADRAFT_195934 [Schizopora paradoxa]|uniref:Uncharacterized protein n=1 Tax=Schizopora paradoxa TaxID=27342 RepID=A0A0H2RZ07_9AGAM|nr:hypothetical protein SCHPADRAFT_195934 [Schizopora paradoxa]
MSRNPFTVAFGHFTNPCACHLFLNYLYFYNKRVENISQNARSCDRGDLRAAEHSSLLAAGTTRFEEMSQNENKSSRKPICLFAPGNWLDPLLRLRKGADPRVEYFFHGAREVTHTSSRKTSSHLDAGRL